MTSAVTSVKLDATPAGRPLYEQLGFTATATGFRWSFGERERAGAA